MTYLLICAKIKPIFSYDTLIDFPNCSLPLRIYKNPMTKAGVHFNKMKNLLDITKMERYFRIFELFSKINYKKRVDVIGSLVR